MKSYKFADVEFMSAKEKMLVLKAWEKFLKSGLRREAFTERLYHHLTMNCSFIAHFDINGFYGTYFGDNKQNTAKFLKMFHIHSDGKSAELGYDCWLHGDYADLNEAMREVAEPYIYPLLLTAQADEKFRDLTEARMLLEKHSIKTEGLIPEWR